MGNANSPISQNPMYFPPVEPYQVLSSHRGPVGIWVEPSEKQPLGNAPHSTDAQEVDTAVPMNLSEYTGCEANVELMDDAKTITDYMVWCQTDAFPSSDDQTFVQHFDSGS